MQYTIRYDMIGEFNVDNVQNTIKPYRFCNSIAIQYKKSRVVARSFNERLNSGILRLCTYRTAITCGLTSNIITVLSDLEGADILAIRSTICKTMALE